jgi:hypothetical protein
VLQDAKVLETFLYCWDPSAKESKTNIGKQQHTLNFHIAPTAILAELQLVFPSRDFPFPISQDPDDFAIPAFPGNRSGIPVNKIY